MTPELDNRLDQTSIAISTVLVRWHDRPRLYRTYGEYCSTLADAYDARAVVWAAGTEHATTTGLSGMLLTALCRARTADLLAAEDLRREAKRADREDRAAAAWGTREHNQAVA